MMYRFVITFMLLLFAVNITEGQSFRDSNNMLLGKVESDGTVRNANNMRLGRIFDDGTVRDNNNMRIGTVSGIDTRCAAVLFFFDFYEYLKQKL